MILVPDLINGCFEAVGGCTGFMNCWRLYKDKQVKGVIWQFNLFYITWGCYNLYFYPHLHQIFSFFGGLLICIGNALWVALVIHYRKSVFKN
jgi:hypothetical protein